MKKTITVKSEYQRDYALRLVKELPLDVVHDVEIKEHKSNRSVSQNALYWLWLTEIGNSYGEMKEEVAERYKDKFLVQIYERDSSDYAEMIEALREVYRQGAKNEALALRKKIVGMTSTTNANVTQMTEYLELIEMDAACRGIELTRPDDYRTAMGVKDETA
jgi:hypothetical protein